MSEKVNDSKLILEAANAIAGFFGDDIEQVYLHGSRAKGIATDESDYDFGVILSERIEKQWRVESEAVEAAADILQKKVDICVVTRKDFEHRRHFYLNIEARIADGKIVMDTGKRAEVIEDHPSVDQLRLEASIWMMRACALNLSQSLVHIADLSPDFSDLARYDVFLESTRAACWSLKTYLLLKNVDTTSKDVRWDPVALTALAISHGLSIDPGIASMFSFIHDIDHLESWIEGKSNDDATQLNTQAFIAVKGVVELLPRDSLKDFLEVVQSDINAAESYKKIIDEPGSGYLMRYIKKGETMRHFFNDLL